ncbi:MAG TPA: serine hydrolase [Vicinamibacterales bacterium]|nr:serine hydrolase [Vicinamibacterales bacterium]
MTNFRTVTLLTILAAATLAAQSASEERIRRIEAGLLPPVILKGQPLRTSRLEDRMRQLKIPGVSVAVFDKGTIEWTRAWGVADATSGQKVDPDTLFQAASLSKPVAAAAALALVAKGRMSLDADINTYLTTWKLPDNEFTAKQKVTLRHLLSHTGGVTVSGFRGYAANEAIPTPLQLLDGTKPANSAAVRVDIPVGTRYRYAGGGYSIVQLAIEEVTKKSFADAARELVLEPLGMRHSTYAQPLPAELHRSAATGHRASGEPVAGRWHIHPEQAAAGLWTTPEDLARFAIAIQQMAAGTAKTGIMSRELAAAMMQPVIDDYGLGLGISGTGRETRFGHGGSNVGFRCTFMAFKDSASGVAVMTNGDRGAEILQDIVRAVAREYGWPGLAPLERTLGSADPAAYKDFAGRYEIPIRSPPVVMVIETDGGKLYRGSGPSRVELLPESSATFFAMDSDMRVEFIRDPNGKVTEARVWQGGIERKATRR